MDALDARILREINRDGVMVWGGLDPRLTGEAIARRLRIDPKTVRTRMRSWEKSGFLAGFEVVPHPRLLGGEVLAGGVRVDDVRDKPRILDDLANVDGIWRSDDLVGPWIGASFFSESRAALDRSLKLLARVPGVSEVQPPFVAREPPCTATPTPLDWRIVAALRRSPRAALADVAADVGVSARTLTRRLDALAKGGATWYLPLLDFSRVEGAAVAKLIVTFARGAERVDVAAAVGDLALSLGPFHHPAPAGASAVSEFFFWLPRPSAIEDAARAAFALPEVADVEHFLLRGVRGYGSWVDERLARKLAAAPRAR